MPGTVGFEEDGPAVVKIYEKLAGVTVGGKG